MRRLASHLLVAALAFSIGIAANRIAQRVATAEETMPPAAEYELASPLPTERICEVHGVRMHLEQVPLHLAGDVDMPVVLDSNDKEFVNHFPHAEGEVSTFDQNIVEGQTVTIYVCPLCRAAHAAWWKKHRAELCTC